MNERNEGSVSWDTLASTYPLEDVMKLKLGETTMSNGANKKGASDLAAALAGKTIDAGEGRGITTDEVETLAEVLNSDPPELTPAESNQFTSEELDRFRRWLAEQEQPKEKVSEPVENVGPVLMKLYDITEKITAASPNTYEQNVTILSGRVTSADLNAAGVDVEWLLKTGAIVEAGFDYV